ncbi:BamA/OMP85 family outer membrane protein [Reichenbachiella versicolor]|uniref:BamA/OMP85 family outer membrane protein n=1 Tax=Reichenbachiella versicolor TaxID=1821036 RepID=UPI001FECD64A|nr:POTRA domain-containing protein [Reichenbachiella versicolor]
MPSRRSSGNANISLSYSSPKEYTIAQIDVEGAEFLDAVALKSISGLKVGDKIKVPGDEISNALKKLWKQGLIGNIEILANKVEGESIYLTIALQERPRLSRFEFSGISKSQESDLKEDIELIRGRVMTNAMVKNTELQVKSYFFEKGFLNTEVQMDYRQDSSLRNSIIMEIKVDKKNKVKIRNVNFVGNTEFSDSKLKSKMKNSGERPRIKVPSAIGGIVLNAFKSGTEKKKLKQDSTTWTDTFYGIIQENIKLNVFKSNKFVKEKYEEDKESLIAFYHSKGYRDAKIVEDTIVNIDFKSLDIDIRVDPGKKYYFRNVYWVGNYIHDDATLDRILSVEKGDVYDMESLDKRLNFNPNGPDISSLYMDNGYLFFSVTPVEVMVEGDSIDVEMRIYEGAQATIKKVYATGNDRTYDHVIMREIRTLPGQKFNRSELIRTQRELSQLGYFDPEQVVPNPLPNPADETVDIEWKLVERPSDQIELSGGWGGNFGFVGTLGLTFNNFSLKNLTHFDKWKPLPVGDGQKLSLRAQANGTQYQSYSVSFSEPWLGGRKPQSFGVSYNYSIQRFNPSGRNFRSFTGSLQVQGVTVSLGRRIQWPDDYFTLSNSVSYLRYALDEYFGNQLGFDTGIANNISFNTTLARNSVDNPMYPRTGSSVSLSLALTPPYSTFNDIDYSTADNADRYKWVEYHKWMFDAKYYMQIAGDLVLETRAHFGYLGSYKPSIGVGPFERFQVGGDGLTGTSFLLGTDIIGLRGYENNSITPIDRERNIRGGTLYNKFTMELRYPVSLNPSATIYVLAFSEAGNNWLNFSDYNPNQMYRSSGFGVRIFMPAFGLLGIDWGYGYDPQPVAGEYTPNQPASGGQIHFSIGQTLR